MMVASRLQLHEELCGIFVNHDPSFLHGVVETGPTLDVQQLAERVMLMDSQSFGASAPIGTTPADTLGALFPTEFYKASGHSSHSSVQAPSKRNKASHSSLAFRQTAANGRFPTMSSKHAPIPPLPPSMPCKSHTPRSYWPQWQSGVPKHPPAASSLQIGSSARQAATSPSVPAQRWEAQDAATGKPSLALERFKPDAANEDAAESDASIFEDELEDERFELLLSELIGGGCVSSGMSSNGSDNNGSSNNYSSNNCSSSSSGIPMSPRKPSSPDAVDLSRAPSFSAGGTDPASLEMRNTPSESTNIRFVIETISSHSSHEETMAEHSDLTKAHGNGPASGLVCKLTFEPSIVHTEEQPVVKDTNFDPKHPVGVASAKHSGGVACGHCQTCIPGNTRCASSPLGFGCVLAVSSPPPGSCSEVAVSDAGSNGLRSESEIIASQKIVPTASQQSLASLTTSAPSRAGSAALSIYSLVDITVPAGSHSPKSLSQNGGKSNSGSFNGRSSEEGSSKASRRNKKGGNKQAHRNSFSGKSSSGDSTGSGYQVSCCISSAASSAESWADPAFIPNRDAAVAQLKGIFPDEDEGLLADLLASRKDDVPAVLQILLDMQQEAQAVQIAATINSLEAPTLEQPQEELSDSAKLAVLRATFPHVGIDQLGSILQASGGSLGEAKVLLHVSLEQEAAAEAKRKLEAEDSFVAHAMSEEAAERAAEEQRLAAEQSASLELAVRLSDDKGEAARQIESEAEDAAIARHIEKQQLAGPSPMATPEDLAAIAALERSTVSVEAAKPTLERSTPTNPVGSGRPSSSGSFGRAHAKHAKRNDYGGGKIKIRDRDLYKKLMAPVKELYSERGRLCKEASVAIRKGEGGRSDQLIKQSLECQRQARDLEAAAMIQLETARNRSANIHNGKFYIDLHGHHPHFVCDRLAEVADILIKSRGALEVAIIVTGKGNHSVDSQAVLRPIVEKWLADHWGYKWRPMPKNSGAFEMFAPVD